MKTKIGMSFGLVMMLAVGVFATMLALGMFATSEVQAKMGPTSDAVGFGEVKISAAVSGPAAGTGDLPTVTVTPDEAGAIAKYTIEFETPSALLAGVDTITIQFEDDVGVPTVLDPSTITIIATKGSSRASGVTGSLVASPLSVSTELVGVPADETEVTLLIPDMGPIEDGTQGIAASEATFISKITVIFNQTAGLTNPTEGTKDYTVKVKTSATGDTGFVTSSTYNIPIELLLNDDNGNRGKTVTAIGRGFQNGTTATVWLDADKDGVLDTDTETVLGKALVGKDDTFVVTFVINVPPFVIGVTANHIRAIDGQPNTDDGAIATYLIDGLMAVTPKEAAVGDTVTVTIKDWPVDEDPTAVTQFTLGGVNIFSTLALLTAAVSITSGEDTFTFDIPDGVTLGNQELKFETASEKDTANMTVLGAALEITPNVVAPNQTVTIQGRGYTDTGSPTIANDADVDSKITIAGVVILEGNIDEGDKVTIDSSGNWVASMVIPVNSVTSEPGTYELKAFDSEGREGVTTITIIARDIQLSPPESRAGTTLTVTGTGYPAVNTTSPQDISISIKYKGSGFSDRSVTTNADSSGTFTTTIGVPLGAGIPSTNTVSVEYTYTQPGTNTSFTVTDALTHRVPGASISIDPVSGPAGTVVTLTGTGFKGTRQVSSLEIGNIDVRQVPVPSTDTEGNFTTSFIVPQMDTGAQSVKAEVGGSTSGTTASASFTLTATAVTPTAAPPSDEQSTVDAFASVIDNEIDDQPNLIGVFQFDNATQTWTSFDPDPDFADFNDLTSVSGGNIVWIRVRNAQDFNGTALVEGWNQIVLR